MMGKAHSSKGASCPPTTTAAGAGSAATAQAKRWHFLKSINRSLRLRPRLYVSVVAGSAGFALMPTSWSLSMRGALAWDTAALVYLASAFHVMATSTSDVILRNAAREDDSRAVILFMILLSIGASFVAIAGLLTETAHLYRFMFLPLALAAVTIVLAWTVTQVVFTMHYAHEYYRPLAGGKQVVGGLDFCSNETPDYWDFFYFATSIGAASQTSDVSIRTKALRRLVTVQAIISFFFNTAVLALSINLAASII
jgi:uncharacterized membrane protein